MDAAISSENSTHTTANSLHHHCVAVTGRLSSLTRTEVAELIRAHGGNYHERVKRNTTLLIVGSDHLPLRTNGRLTVNLRRGIQLQGSCSPIEVLSEDDFYVRLGVTSSNSFTRSVHTIGEVSRLAGIDRDQLRAWVRNGFVQPVKTVGTLHYFDFRQVATLQRLQELRSAGVSLSRLQHSYNLLKRWLPHSASLLPQLDQLGSLLAVRREDGRLTDVSGQLLMDYSALEEESKPVSLSLASSLHSSRDHDNLFDEAAKHELEGEFELAVAAYRKYLQQSGPDAAASFNLANVLRELNELSAAVERYRQAIELEPDFVDAWNNLGDVLADLERNEEAIDAWNNSLQWNPNNLDALYNLAEMLESLDRCNEAREFWQSYLRCDSESEWAAYALRCLEQSSA